MIPRLCLFFTRFTVILLFLDLTWDSLRHGLFLSAPDYLSHRTFRSNFRAAYFQSD